MPEPEHVSGTFGRGSMSGKLFGSSAIVVIRAETSPDEEYRAMQRNFRTLIEDRWSYGKFVCVGLDSDFDKIPECCKWSRPDGTIDAVRTLATFNGGIISVTRDLVCAYKPNLAFYSALGIDGELALQQTVQMCHSMAPEVPVILDAKDGDIDNTNVGYVRRAFEHCRADAITLHPYMGSQSLQPFLGLKDKGMFILCRTSNKGSDEFQDLTVIRPGVSTPGGRQMLPLYQYVAERVSKYWNVNGNCGLVVGATYPKELEAVRSIVGDMPILIPGFGAQGGDLERSVAAGKDSRGRGMIINSSRGVIFASSGPDYADAARREVMRLGNAIDACR